MTPHCHRNFRRNPRASRLGLVLVLSISCTILILHFAAAASTVGAAPQGLITVINAYDSGPGSLRQALADATAGDTIVFSLPANANIVVLNSPLSVYVPVTIDGSTAVNLNISGNYNQRIFDLHVPVTIISLTLSNAYTPAEGSAINALSSLTLTHVLVTNNFPLAAVAGNGRLSMEDSDLHENTGALSWSGDAYMTRGSVRNEHCFPLEYCPQYAEESVSINGSLTVRDTQFISNSRRALTVYGVARIEGALFQNNPYGAIQAADSGLSISGTRFISNSIGIYLMGSTSSRKVRIVNSLFVRDRGPALIVAGPAAVEMLYTTIASPVAGPAAALYVRKGTLTVTNSIIATNTIGIDNGDSGAVYEDYNLLFANGIPRAGPVVSGPHHPAGDPLFVSPLNDDYHLRNVSPAIDAALDVGISDDLDGNPRPFGLGFDLGAYEGGLPALFKTFAPYFAR